MSQCSWAGGGWSSGIKDGPLPSPAVLWVVSVCEENPDRKKSDLND